MVRNLHRFDLDPWSRKLPHTTGHLSLWATTTEPKLWSPCSATREASIMRSLCAATREQPWLEAEKAHVQQGIPTAKNK